MKIGYSRGEPTSNPSLNRTTAGARARYGAAPLTAALPATVPLDHAHWKLNAGSAARPRVAIGHIVLRSANMDEWRATDRGQ